ncbi:hypothetical protein [Paenibacillus chungangensis]|uniref:Uncharacterized protein n=1 Tax=Paenibacillus chungangensis TaxID=696535 RepID=A0ABW3HWC1_9BACL
MLRSNKFKRLVQTVTYMPHFILIIVICGILVDFLARDGLINDLIAFLGLEHTPFLGDSGWFRTAYTPSNICHIRDGALLFTYLQCRASILPYTKLLE